MGDAGLDHQVRPDLPDQLLHRNHILWILDNGTAQRGEVVGILGSDRCNREIPCSLSQIPVVSIRGDPRSNLVIEFTHYLSQRS